MRILVTGSAGFIGFHLCRRLLAEGHEVAGVDAMVAYYDPKLKAVMDAMLKKCEDHAQDLLDKAEAAKAEPVKTEDDPGYRSEMRR